MKYICDLFNLNRIFNDEGLCNTPAELDALFGQLDALLVYFLYFGLCA